MKNYKLCTTQNCYMKALLPFLFLYWSRPRLNVFRYKSIPSYRYSETFWEASKLYLSFLWIKNVPHVTVQMPLYYSLRNIFLQRGLSLIRVGIRITCIRKVLIFANSCPGNVSKTLSLSHMWQCPTRDTKSLLLNIHEFMELMSTLVLANAFWASNKYILM